MPLKALPAFRLVSPVDGVEDQNIHFDCNFDGGDGSQDDISNEVIKTVQYLVDAIEDLRDDDELLQLLSETEPTDFDDTRHLCQVYNDKMTALKVEWRTSNQKPAYFQERASGAFLRHILRQCYERAVDNPAILNSYPPFSSQVYGETSFELVEAVLEAVPLGKEDVFVDLGSGVGQVVLQVAASSEVKLCRGIEKADYPALCADRMQEEFRNLMRFYGKPFQPFQLEKSDFLLEENREKILQSTVVFVNNYAFGPDVDHHLMESFKHLNQDAKIISSKAYRPKNFRITDRNLCDLASILRTEELPPKKVSWTATTLSYTVHTVDRSLLEEYFANTKLRNGHENQRNNGGKMCRSASVNALDKANRKSGTILRSASHSTSGTPTTRQRQKLPLAVRPPVNGVHKELVSGRTANKGAQHRLKNGLRRPGRRGRPPNRLREARLPVAAGAQKPVTGVPEGKNCNPHVFSTQSSVESCMNGLTLETGSNLGSPTRLRRPALSLAQAALQRCQSKRTANKAPPITITSITSGDELTTPSVGDTGPDSRISPSLNSTPRSGRRSRLTPNYHEGIMESSTSDISTPSTLTKSKSNQRMLPDSSQRKSLTRRSITAAMSSPGMGMGITPTITPGGGGGPSSTPQDRHQQEVEYVQRHNIGLLHEDMRHSLSHQANPRHTSPEICGANDLSMNRFARHEYTPHIVEGLNGVQRELAMRSHTHPGYLNPQHCVPLAIEQMLDVYRQQLMDWFSNTHRLAHTPSHSGESMLVVEIRTLLEQELQRRDQLKLIVKEKARKVVMLTKETGALLQQVLEKLSIFNVCNVSDMIRQAKEMLAFHQELKEHAQRACSVMAESRATHRQLRDRLKQMGGQRVLQRLKHKLTEKAAAGSQPHSGGSITVTSSIPPPIVPSTTVSTTMLSGSKPRVQPIAPAPVAMTQKVAPVSMIGPTVFTSPTYQKPYTCGPSYILPSTHPRTLISTQPLLVSQTQAISPPVAPTLVYIPPQPQPPPPHPLPTSGQVFPTADEAPLRMPVPHVSHHPAPVYSPISGSESIPRGKGSPTLPDEVTRNMNNFHQPPLKVRRKDEPPQMQIAECHSLPTQGNVETASRVQHWLERCVLPSGDSNAMYAPVQLGGKPLPMEVTMQMTPSSIHPSGVEQQHQQMLNELFNNCVSSQPRAVVPGTMTDSPPFIVTNVSLTSASGVPSPSAPTYTSVIPPTHLPPRERWRSTHTAWRHGGGSGNPSV